MCTVSFLPAGDGFHLAMNRDEQLSRRAALPPRIAKCGAFRALYPHEWSGGTWIGVNAVGLTFALINWYSEPQRLRAGTVSRGEVIPALLGAATVADAEAHFGALPVASMNPFRLIVISRRERALCEWKSSGGNLEGTSFSWERRHWFSSGFDEAAANRVRALTCARASRLAPPASPAWLRDLHRSHHPSKGALSICMHRIDACTVSFTELSVTGSSATMSYHAGPACERGPRFVKALRLSRQIPCAAA